MKEIRGAAAIRYAEEFNIHFDIDEDFLAGAEEEMSGRPTSVVDVYELIEERTGQTYDPAEIVPGKPIFDFLINRYGDAWIYIAFEGKDPKAEEKVALRMFRRLLGERQPVYLIDVRQLLWRYSRTRLGDTGFPRDADFNLLFHAALRLVEKGVLECTNDEESLRAAGKASYGRRRFGLTPDVEVSLADVLCDRCRRERGEVSMSLHTECARKLKLVLGKATSRVSL